MNIEAYTNVLNKVSQLDSMDVSTVSNVNSNEFSSVFNDALNQFTTSQQLSEQATESLIVGDDVALHNIMIQTTEAQLSLELAIQVRNKCLEAYNDIKNMQF